MARLGIDKDFLREFAKLERPVQERVTEVFGKFEESTWAGLHLEKVTNARDDRFRTIRIDQFWRGVVLAPTSGDNYTLLKVLPHDDAYAWARRRRASVNIATGRIEISDVEAIDATVPELTRMAAQSPQPLFAAVSDADLRRLGIDQDTLAFARVLTHPVQLDAARGLLPSNQWDVLFGLAAGLSPEEVWDELGATATAVPYDPDDVAAAVERTPDRVVLVDGPAELMEIFRHPFAQWRIYLHPVQYQMVHARYSGPARVTGAPGTGKTVAALHRARYLAGQGLGRVLVTTFTSTLAASLQAGIRLLVDAPADLAAIEVRLVDHLAHQIVAMRHGGPTILQSRDERELRRAIIDKYSLPFTDKYLAEEWREVVLAQQVTSAADYLAAKRTGRGRGLGARQRAQVWQGIWELQNHLADHRLWTHETVCLEATRLLAEAPTKPYRHVVVDEAQDLSAVQWRLLRAAVAPAENDLFIAGDTHQRIYNNRVSLRDLGITVTGRSGRLTVNYRTTAEILGWSVQMLHGEQVDDMNDGLDTLAGCRSAVHGLPPQLRGFPTRADELSAAAAQVRDWLDAGIRPGEIGVAARTTSLAKAAVAAAQAAGIPVRLLGASENTEDAVSVATMHRMKGLEFRCLAVIGAGADLVPLPGAITPVEEDEPTHHRDLQRERCLLFVACTRVREQLAVSWHGRPSPFLSPVP